MNIPIINNIEAIVSNMHAISLSEMKHVKLLHRNDTKFVLSLDKIPALLLQMQENYRVLEVEGTKTHIYKTTYFDTPTNDMYHQHHNGRMNRYKIRMRQYVVNNLFYLEVKFKNNKGETIKKRIKLLDKESIDANNCVDFLKMNSPYLPSDIAPSIHNSFTRITLVHNTLPERITLDFGLHFSTATNNQTQSLNGVAIIEVKRDLNTRFSETISILKMNRIHEMGFSKYCIGKALIENNNEVKINLLKLKVRQIIKLNHYN